MHLHNDQPGEKTSSIGFLCEKAVAFEKIKLGEREIDHWYRCNWMRCIDWIPTANGSFCCPDSFSIAMHFWTWAMFAIDLIIEFEFQSHTAYVLIEPNILVS